MNRRWTAAALTTLLAAATLVAMAQPAAAALGPADFLKVSGSVLKKDSGLGATTGLRGTNLGGWLTQEDWMSPLGEFAADRTGWAVTASPGHPTYGEDAARAIDGDGTTRWTTGSAMNGGEWLSVDLGALSRFNRVAFDHTEFTGGDFPRYFVVEVSGDGTAWRHAYDGPGSDAATVTTARFTPVIARHVRVRQTGAAAYWWSVGEFNVFNDKESFDPTQWTASASHGSTPAGMIDEHVASRWTTETGQAPGQWVQLDLGARMTINNVTLDSEKNTTSEDDYPRGYTVLLSGDQSNWTQVASGAGRFKATNINFPPASARFVRVVQTGTSFRWWSIGTMSVGLNGDDYDLQLTMDDRFGRAVARTIRDAHEDTWITAADLDDIAAMGLNFVRLPMGWTTFLNLDGTWKADPWGKIDWLVEELADRGLYTLLDLHTVPGGGCPWGSCGRAGVSPNEFWANAEYQTWVEDIWEAVATRYAGDPAVAGYGLINEPLVDENEDADDVAKKSAYYDRLYDAVRAVDADHVIFLGAFFDHAHITPPSLHGWTNVVYELHPYDMDHPTQWEFQNQLVSDKLNDLTGLLASPGVPVLYGEYSLYYFDDVWARWMAGLNARQQSWSNWTYKTKGTDADSQGYWGFHYNRPAPVPVINSDDAATFVRKLQRFGTGTFTRNDRLAATVAKYAGGLSTFAPVPISTTGWNASASSTGPHTGTVQGAYDGNGSTRWDTGAAQTPGQWYRVDLGAPRTIAQVTVQTPGNALGDYPRGYRLEFSMNDTTWTTVATGIGFGWKRPITVTPQTARYVRITQTGSTGYWWSIDEITMYSSY
ncbi:discoidin domain-containing protein [Sphaerisporangium aureirubrum]|uniref:Exo-1,3-beta-glucanase D n=1 Tax=Sphaerisporangium aureirubrum TaxID=1544736 RepID=A0ABW1NMZ6_9ACTN